MSARASRVQIPPLPQEMKTDYVYVKESRINGRGAFAARGFKKGEIVLQWDVSNTISPKEYDKLAEKEKNYVSFFDGKYVVMQEPERFVNHSCSPNTTAKNFCDFATKDIKAGEEVTGDYSEELAPNTEMTCNCGGINCRKIIKGPKS